ncbi:MAG: DNA repair and recombination protein RadB [Halobacteria archaeon]|nr:DNA repair and recombination protein RadB [Halobacteria archaeon]
MSQKLKGGDVHLTTGCESLDSLLGGGFERGVVSQLYGLPGTGKTNICIQTAVETIRDGGSVVYIDTEGFSPARFEQIAGDDSDEIAREFIVKEVYDFDEQVVAVRDVENLASEIDLVILDSATGLYRVEPHDEDANGSDDESPLKRLTRQVTHLTSLARRYDFAAVITNQVYTRMENGMGSNNASGNSNGISPLGGRMVEHWTKAIVRLEKSGGNSRKAFLEKHRSQPTGRSASFHISDDGIESP